MAKTNKKSAFSLIEVLVALTIISVCFSVFMQALSLNIKNTGVSKSYITAVFLAKKKLVKLQSSAKFEVGTKEGDFGDNFPGFEWKTDISDQSKYLFLIKLTILFKRNSVVRSITFRTLSLNEKEIKKETDKNKSSDKAKSSSKDSSSKDS